MLGSPADLIHLLSLFSKYIGTFSVTGRVQGVLGMLQGVTTQFLLSVSSYPGPSPSLSLFPAYHNLDIEGHEMTLLSLPGQSKLLT